MLLSRVQVLAAALLFSTGGFAVKSCALGGWQIAGFRCGVAALAVWILLPAARRRWRWREVAVGCAYAGTLICYALATKWTTAANAIFLQSAAPLYILVLAPLLLGEKARTRDLALAAWMALGLVLVLGGRGPLQETAPDPVQGNVFGLLAGGFWALTVMGLRRLSATPTSGPAPAGETRNAALVSLVAGNVVAFVVCLPWALPVVESTWTDWAWIAYLGVFQIGLAYLFLTAGLRHLPAFEASILLLVEPVFNPIWTWFLHGEVPSSLALLGGLLILLGTAAKTWVDLRRRRHRPPG